MRRYLLTYNLEDLFLLFLQFGKFIQVQIIEKIEIIVAKKISHSWYQLIRRGNYNSG